MKENQTNSFIPKCFSFAILITIPILLVFSHRTSFSPLNSSNDTIINLKIRPGYSSYIQRQLNKNFNPKLHKLWSTNDWNRKTKVFSNLFNNLKHKGLLSNSSKVLCIGSRIGQEVEALKRVGVFDSIGFDLVVRGDFHKQPFDDEIFDMEFSNVLDHALYPHKFVEEIERTLKPGGVCVLHVALSNHLYSLEVLKKLFKRSQLIHANKVDRLGLHMEVVFRKNRY